MESNNDLFPEDVVEALGRGQKIEAIKRLRAATGMGLKEAKDMIDGYGGEAQKEMTGILSDPASVAEALKGGHKILAIKQLREQTGMGLKEAKEAVESMQEELFVPGRAKPSSNRLSWAVFLLVLIGYGIYYLFQ